MKTKIELTTLGVCLKFNNQSRIIINTDRKTNPLSCLASLRFLLTESITLFNNSFFENSSLFVCRFFEIVFEAAVFELEI
jgi:hypothetical protein